MRGRHEEPDLWGDLYERLRRPGDPARRRRGGGLSPDASGRLYDAAIGILGSLRTVIDVAEEVLEDRRARAGEPRSAEPWIRAPESPVRPSAPSAEEGGVVRDIPFGDA